MELIMICAMFGGFGVGLSTTYAALKLAGKRRSRPHYNGYSSALYFPFYALAPILFDLCHKGGLLIHSTAVRGLVYMAIFFAIEYAGNWLLQKVDGASPSEKSYRRSRWHVHGRIKLTLAPVWFLMGLGFEYLLLMFKP